MKPIKAVIFVIFLFPGWSSAGTFEEYMTIKHLRCSLDKGIQAISGKEISSITDSLNLIFDSIDVNYNKARMIGNIGAFDVRVTATPKGLTFEEVTPSGNITSTTVLIEELFINKFPVVHSRHLFIDGKAMHSQRYGTCWIP